MPGYSDPSPRQELTLPTRIAGIFRLLSSNWAVFSLAITICGLAIGWLVFDISPWRPLQEIAHKQEQEELTKVIIQRHFRLGKKMLDVGQADEAKKTFESVLKLEPHNAEAQFGLIKAEIFQSIRSKKYDPEVAQQRVEVLLKELKERQNDPDPHLLLFLAHVNSAIDQNRAVDLYGEVLKHDPEVAEAYNGLGSIYDAKADEYRRSLAIEEAKAAEDKAIEMFQKALEKSEWNQWYGTNLVNVYMKRRDYKRAIEKNRLLISLNGNYVIPYYDIADAYRLTGQLDDARYWLRILLSLWQREDVKSLDRNKEDWLYSTDCGDEYYIVLSEMAEKEKYAYYNMALTLYLMNRERGATWYVEKAKTLSLKRDQDISLAKLLFHHMRMLKEAEEREETKAAVAGYGDKVNEFGGKAVPYWNKVLSECGV